MTGFRILLGKELRESWRTFRLPVVVGIFLFTGLTSPLMARFLPEIFELAGGEQFGSIVLPTPTTSDAVDQLVKNMGQFGALSAILLAMGLVAGEKDRGTAAFVLVKPVSRGAFLAAKLVAVGLVLAVGTVAGVLVGWVYTAILFEPMAPAGWIALAGLTWLSLFAYAALTFVGSVVTGSTAAAAGIGFVALLVLGIVAALPSIGRLTPAGLVEPAASLAAGTASVSGLGMDLVVPVAATLAVIAGAIAVSAWAFARQEL